MSTVITKEKEIHTARNRLERDGWPRLQMSGIVLTTGAAGLLGSYVLLQSGMHSMAARYPLAILIAYAVFLLLLWCWLRWGCDWIGDAVEAGAEVGLNVGVGPGRGAFATDAPTGAANWSSAGKTSSSKSNGLPDLDVDGDFAIPALAIAAFIAVIAAAVVALGWVVWSAPLLMAELMVDAAIAGGLYRHLRRHSAEGWWYVAVRRTFLPLLALLAFFWGTGVALGAAAPEAVTLFQALDAVFGP